MLYFNALNDYILVLQKKSPEVPITVFTKPTTLEEDEDCKIPTYRIGVNNLEKLGFIFEPQR